MKTISMRIVAWRKRHQSITTLDSYGYSDAGYMRFSTSAQYHFIQEEHWIAEASELHQELLKVAAEIEFQIGQARRYLARMKSDYEKLEDELPWGSE